MVHFLSKIGGRSENQDFYGSTNTQYGELIIVCDGMGGHNGGRHAAEKAVKIILDEVSNSTDEYPAAALKTAIENANAAIWHEGSTNRELKGMGSTVVALLLTKENAICCHVGDSRIYQFRADKILFRTVDHSFVFEMVQAGLLTEEQARLSEKSNIITRALGIQPTVDVEITDNLTYNKGDRFLLCTDGICGALSETELVQIAAQNSDIKTITVELVEKIDRIGFENGGRHDNLTAALIEIETESTEKGKNWFTQKKIKIVFLLAISILVILLAIGFYLVIKQTHTTDQVQPIKVEKQNALIEPDSLVTSKSKKQ